MWPEVKEAKEEKRYELVLTGDAINERILEEGEIDPSVYSLVQLNFFRVNKTSLTKISEGVGCLSNLTNLALQNNKLENLPDEVGKLDKLKLLDISFNCLETLPESICSLNNLATINASNNNINSLPSFEKCISLAHLDLCENKLGLFPDVCYEDLALLAEIRLSGNVIKELPPSITALISLKYLDLSKNEVTMIPGDVVDCLKLKDLLLKGNALTDRRFRKLVESDRCLPRQVLDYVKQHCPKQVISDDPNGVKGSKRKGGKKSKGQENQIETLCEELKVINLAEGLPVIKVTSGAKEVRPYIVCCIFQRVDLSGDKLRQFLVVQTKLHDTICDKRLAATIATHDLAKINGPLTFAVGEPDKIQIHPLLKGKVMSAKLLYKSLKNEAEAQRKQQKRNNPSGLHRYLHLVEKWASWPYLIDANGTVISLPPITNSETTKITSEAVNLFIEVTSSTSLNKAKEVMDAFVLASLQIGISVEKQQNGKSILSVQQVRVEDESDSSLRVLYPSRTDLIYENENVCVSRA